LTDNVTRCIAMMDSTPVRPFRRFRSKDINC
jgi:hypothetical protein